jgi:hypothetical protein
MFQKTAAAAAAAAGADESAVDASNEDVQLSAAEREAFRETLKEQYVHLIEMDGLVREKLFILQVRKTTPLFNKNN